MSDRTACRQALPNAPPSRSLTQHAYAHLNSSCTRLLYLTPAARQSAMRRCGCSPPSQCGASAGVRTSAQHRCGPSCSCSMGGLAAKWRDRAEASAHAHVLPDRQFEAPLTVADLSKSLQCIGCAISFGAQVLSDPQFVAHSAATLTDLINIPFTAGGWSVSLLRSHGCL